nr:hypothetical protein B0A51_07145 [Rachicladosporium sp. CCFEE 5018]
MVLVSLAEGILAIFLPPLAVLLRTGCSLNFLLNIFLTALAWVPGVIHAWVVILAVPGLREKRRERRRSVEKEPRGSGSWEGSRRSGSGSRHRHHEHGQYHRHHDEYRRSVSRQRGF